MFLLKVTEMRGPEAGQSCYVMDDEELNNCNNPQLASKFTLDRALEVIRYCLGYVDSTQKWEIIPVSE